MQSDYIPRVALVGPYNSGKTTLAYRMVTGEFCPGTRPTFCPNIFVLETPSGTRYTLMDTAGMERYHSVTTAYMRDMDIVLCCQEKSKRFEDEYMCWRQVLVSEHIDTIGHCVQVLTKADLCGEHTDCIECSSLDGAGIETLRRLVDKLVDFTCIEKGVVQEPVVAITGHREGKERCCK